MERRLTWLDRILYAVVFAVLALLIFGVDTAPHIPGPITVEQIQEASR